MSDIILKTENISKQYRLGVVGLGTLAHDFNRFWHKIRGKEDPYLSVGSVNDRSVKAKSDYVWALQDINFEVKRGEVLGIIGKNGAGKSTLLKILSRVTAPTTGSIKTAGRIASLLEVGTGMHPELTGRENIFLNGAILGMTKAEISNKIDEIIEFSGCEMYIDTPVKRYSSGMRVRLGFAVAAFLEPEILVVDEVLAVGDAEFQKKAIGKMKDISNEGGRTVLFVSHNMVSVKQLCDRIIILDNGSLKIDTKDVDKGIEEYLKEDSGNVIIPIIDRKDRVGNGNLLLKSVMIHNDSNEQQDVLMSGMNVGITFECLNVHLRAMKNVLIAMSVIRKDGAILSTFYSELTNDVFEISKTQSKVSITCEIHNFPFSGGTYNCNVSLRAEGEMTDWIQNAFQITVVDGDFFNSGRKLPESHNGVLINHKWKMSYEESNN